MPASVRHLLLLSPLLAVSCAFGEDVQVTVFTMNDGTKVDVLSYASATQGAEAVYSVTTTAGEKKMLWGNEVARKESIQKPVGELPEFARNKIEAQHKAERDWAERSATEKSAEERKRTEAFIKGEALDAKYDVVRAASAEEVAARQRCAVIWDAQQADLTTAKTAQDAISRARTDYLAAEADLRSLERQQPTNAAEIDRWRNRCARAERRMASAQSQIADATGDLTAATDKANQHAAELAQAKAVLAQAQAKVAEAQRQYDEAREQAKRKPVPSDPAGETIRPADQATKEARPVQPPGTDSTPAVPSPKSTVVRSFENGEFVQLADGSLWEIHPEDRAETVRWRQEQEVVVVNGNDPTYANRLINSAIQGAAKAKRLK